MFDKRLKEKAEASEKVRRLTEEIDTLSKRVWELENPARITSQNLKIRGDTLEFNGHSVSVRRNPYFVNSLRVKPFDTIKDAVIVGRDINIEMNSGDKFVLENYSCPHCMVLQRESGEVQL